MTMNPAVLQRNLPAPPARDDDVLRGLVARDDAARRRFRREGVLGLAASYLDGEWSADRLDELMLRVLTSPATPVPPAARARIAASRLVDRLVNRQSRRRAFNIGRKHYDLGNDLFRGMLDGSMTYTSGYWAEARTLDAAQEAKLELVCRKLDLRPGERVLDVGCGWGNFAHHAATRHGASVTGVTVSKEQAEVARARCADLPVEIRLQDYRELEGTFDHVVSIEMIEAVGRRNIPTFYEVVDRCLADGGRFVLEVISGDTLSATSDRRLDQFMLWLVEHIFPDGYLPKPAELVPPPATALRIEDWHEFGADYDRTLLAWAERFEEAWAALDGAYDERFRRRWRFYLLTCAAAFRAQLVDLYQIVYVKGGAARPHAAVR